MTQGRVDIPTIKSHARGRWRDILISVGGIDGALLDGRNHPCPKCGGRDRFAVVDMDRGALICRKCFHERNGDGIAAVAWLAGMTTGETLRAIASYLGIQAAMPASRRAAPQPDRQPDGDEQLATCLARLERSHGRPALSWEYHDINGSLVGAVLRWNLPGGDKTYRPISLHPDGKWRATAMPQPRPLYQLPLLSVNDTIYVAEGEKCADALASVGLIATTSSGGASAAKHTDWTPLGDKTVIILPDKNDAGARYAESVRGLVEAAGGKPYILNLPDLPDNKDVADWIDARRAAGRSTDQILDELLALTRRLVSGLGSDILPVVTGQELDSAQYVMRYAVSDILVEEQPMFIAGYSKTLKTMIALDMAVSLATGARFLGRFGVEGCRRVLYLSGEGGLPVLQDYARRVCASKGTRLGALDNLGFCDRVPRLGDLAHVAELERLITAFGAEFVFLDPLYLSIPAEQAGIVQAQGAFLYRFGLSCLQSHATPIIIHHTSKSSHALRSQDWSPPQLHDMAGAGVVEYAGQWLLLGRREAYNPETPWQHRLWASAGGRAGHSGIYAVDVDESPAEMDSPRTWRVAVATPNDMRAADAERRKRETAEKQAAAMERRRKTVLLALLKAPDGLTIRSLSDLIGASRAVTAETLHAMASDGIVESVEGRVNGRDRLVFRVTDITRKESMPLIEKATADAADTETAWWSGDAAGADEF